MISAAAGLLVAWLRPWQGATLLAILAGLVVVNPPRRRYLALLPAAAATAAPLIYGELLAHADASWAQFQRLTSTTSTAPWWALLLTFGPLALMAGLGLRRPNAVGDWMLVLWIAAVAAVYFLIPEYPPHALSGVVLPLSVLAVRGFVRVPLRGWGRRGVALAAVAVFTIPAAIYHLQNARQQLGNATFAGAAARPLLILTGDQAAALRYLDRNRRPGAVLAPWLLSMSIPELTGRAVYAGHLMWQPPAHLALTNAFFSSGLADAGGRWRRSLVRRSRAAFVVADCGAPAQVAAALAPITVTVTRFGCVSVYAIRFGGRRGGRSGSGRGSGGGPRA